MAGRPEKPKVESISVIVWNRKKTRLRIAFRCAHCGGVGIENGKPSGYTVKLCKTCNGDGWFGIDPRVPTSAMPGSDVKVAVLQARVSLELPTCLRGDGRIPCCRLSPEEKPMGFQDKSRVYSDGIWEYREWKEREKLREKKKRRERYHANKKAQSCSPG